MTSTVLLVNYYRIEWLWFGDVSIFLIIIELLGFYVYLFLMKCLCFWVRLM